MIDGIVRLGWSVHLIFCAWRDIRREITFAITRISNIFVFRWKSINFIDDTGSLSTEWVMRNISSVSKWLTTSGGSIFEKKIEKYPTLGVRDMNLTIVWVEESTVFGGWRTWKSRQCVAFVANSSSVDMIRTVILTLRRSDLDRWRRRSVSAGFVLWILMGTSSMKTRHSIESRIGYTSVKVPLTNPYFQKYE